MQERGAVALAELVRRHAVVSAFVLGEDTDRPFALMKKYAEVPMSFADACLVRMTETLPRAVPLTTDWDFRVYRRHGRQAIVSVLPA